MDDSKLELKLCQKYLFDVAHTYTCPGGESKEGGK